MVTAIIGAWVVMAFVVVVMLLIIRRLGGVSNMLKIPAAAEGLDVLQGTRLPPLRVRMAGGDNPGPAREQRVRFDEGTLVVFAAPRCVSSHRLLTDLAGRLAGKLRPDFPVVIGIAADAGDCARVLSEFDLGKFSVSVTDARFLEKASDFIPFAVSLGAGNLVEHAGPVDSDSAVYRFAEACGSPVVREWFRETTIAT